MTEEGKYIYSIIKENRDRNFGPIGINNREVNLLCWRDIAAVVSSTPIIKFDRLAKEELARHVSIHQKVNEAVLSAKGGSVSGGKEYDVVPMSFGIIAPSKEEVERILKKSYLQFKTALTKVEGKVEFVVQAWWNPKKVLKSLSADEEIQKLRKEKIGILGLARRLKLGKLLQEKTENLRKIYLKNIEEYLKSLSSEFTSNKLIETKNSLPQEEQTIANFSFLIERKRESELDKRMNELGKKYEDKLRFKYIGPMPAYSFVNINLKLGNFEVVDEARKVLGLEKEVTFDEIKKAYYALAHKHHPDKQGDSRKMKKIAYAYSVLENYCQSCGQKQKYSFREKDVKKVVLVR